MAGAYPQGREYNILHDAESAKTVFAQWPKEIYIADFHLGRDVYSGRGVAERTYACPHILWGLSPHSPHSSHILLVGTGPVRGDSTLINL